ncbi:MAG TPA: FG-GAP-like repeat-containing protein [Bryobacteraceae bacterium]|nr:FG-GAP-like repeat-containing protein [Bryobacteraceae bacterium]
MFMRTILVVCVAAACAAQVGHIHDDSLPPAPTGPLREIGLLLRQSKTEEARKIIQALLRERTGDAELYHQLARSYLLDFYEGTDPAKMRTALALAMEALASTLQRNPDHIPALKAKAVIHARAELLYYNPNLAFELAARIARLQPSANEYLLNLTEWLSGEVRFNRESEHRVPHDPLLGLNWSIQLLERVLDSTMPYSNEEGLAFYAMGRSLAKRGSYKESVPYFQRALTRPSNVPWHAEILRELAVSHYRLGEFAEAARRLMAALKIRPSSVDQWLLSLAADKANIQVPDTMRFPVAEPKIDTAKPPLLAFEDIAPALGVNRRDGNGTCSWGDYDGDGKLDLFLAGSGTFIAVYRNEGGKFRDVTAEVGLARVPSGYSLNVIDYDNDGRIDLYISYNGWSGPMPNRLYRNVGGRFEDVSKKSGADDPGSGFVSLWADFDNDGHLDFAVANGVLKDGSTPQIYRNRGDGTFVNMTREAGINEPSTYGAIGIALGDYDRDGDVDLFVNSLINAPNRLYRNDGKFHFVDVSRQSGVQQQPLHNGFVAFFTDYNNDAWPDLLVTSLAPWDAVVEALKSTFFVRGPQALHPDSTRLLRNNQKGTFTDVTYESKLWSPMGVMGAGVADLDNDGWIDFYFGTGDPQLSRLEPNRFFHNNGDGTFSDLTNYVPFARPGNKGHGVTFIDFDEDGDLDIYAQLGGHYPGDHAENAFYRNLKGNQNRWLQVDLIGTKSHRHAIGAQITVKAGKMTVFREVKGSEGFGATSPYRQHFGLGRETRVDSLEIVWPSGFREMLEGLETNRILQIKEGQTVQPAPR